MPRGSMWTSLLARVAFVALYVVVASGLSVPEGVMTQQGFEVELYYDGEVPNARSLTLSGASDLDQAIVYASSMRAGQAGPGLHLSRPGGVPEGVRGPFSQLEAPPAQRVLATGRQPPPPTRRSPTRRCRR
jgi:hypothetical protein